MPPQVNLRSSPKEIFMKKNLDIGEVVQLTGLAPSTLRFYEEKGLIQSAGRNGLRRYFDPRVLVKLDFIAMGQHAGFSLDEIADMFTANGHIQVNRGLLVLKAKEIQQEIKLLGAICDTLQHVAKCSASDHLECPKFQRLLRLAGKKNTKDRKVSTLKPKKSKHIKP